MPGRSLPAGRALTLASSPIRALSRKASDALSKFMKASAGGGQKGSAALGVGASEDGQIYSLLPSGKKVSYDAAKLSKASPCWDIEFTFAHKRVHVQEIREIYRSTGTTAPPTCAYTPPGQQATQPHRRDRHALRLAGLRKLPQEEPHRQAGPGRRPDQGAGRRPGHRPQIRAKKKGKKNGAPSSPPSP